MSAPARRSVRTQARGRAGHSSTAQWPLTSSDEFKGGGTGFWAGGRTEDENPFVDPAAVLKPDLGTALVFGGDVTHAGMPVDAGLRAVLVASFSTRTDASVADRCFGLQFSESSELSDVFGS